MICVCFSGCRKAKKREDGKYHIVLTIFAEYDWVKEIVGDAENVEMTYLLKSGTDMHNYQPTTKDTVAISSCDMFIFVGGESDKWTSDALKSATNKDMTAICLMDVLKDHVKEEEHFGEEDDHDEDDHENDEHVWLSLKNAATVCEYISAKLCEKDPENKEKYAENTKKYIEKLKALDAKYEEEIGKAETKTLIFGDRFPFRYLTDDYGITYYAAFSGCSSETEASFNTIISLAGKADELGVKAIMQTETSDGKIPKAIIENTNSKDLKILTLDSLQSVSLKEASEGKTYIAAMESNLAVLGEALN